MVIKTEPVTSSAGPPAQKLTTKVLMLERSLDGVNYSSIGFVNSLAVNGNSSVKLDYAFVDNNVNRCKTILSLTPLILITAAS